MSRFNLGYASVNLNFFWGVILALVGLAVLLDQLHCNRVIFNEESVHYNLSGCKDSDASRYKIRAVYNSFMDKEPVALMEKNLPYSMQIVGKDNSISTVEVISAEELLLKNVISVCVISFQRTLGSEWHPQKIGDPIYTIVEVSLIVPTSDH